MIVCIPLQYFIRTSFASTARSINGVSFGQAARKPSTIRPETRRFIYVPERFVCVRWTSLTLGVAPGAGPWYGGGGHRVNPGDVAATISIPHKKVGLIIGRGGENIRFLQQQTRAHIQIQTEHDAAPNQPERTVFLRGPKEACAEAARMIQDMIDGMLHIGSSAIVPPQPPMPPNVTPAQAHQIAMQAQAGRGGDMRGCVGNHGGWAGWGWGWEG